LDGETLGSRIRARRVLLGITPANLASSVGLSHRAINQIETGILNSSFMADYIPKIAEVLETTTDSLLNGELHSERLTREELYQLRKEGIIRNDAELQLVEELATDTIKKRRNANIPLNRDELLILIEVMRGSDGL